MYRIITSLINHFKYSLILTVCCLPLCSLRASVMHSERLHRSSLKVDTGRRLRCLNHEAASLSESSRKF